MSSPALHYIGGANAELVGQFFSAFARAEYLLKRVGFHKRGQENAQADWDAYASSLKGLLNKTHSARVRNAWRYLSGRPPRKQVIQDGQLSWKDVPRPVTISDEAYALLLVRRVRNNLFHGGKFLHPDGDNVRDKKLVNASLVILDACLLASRRLFRKNRIWEAV